MDVQRTHTFLVALATIAATAGSSACAPPDHMGLDSCENGLVCPPDTRCVVRDGQAACLSPGCGDGILDPGEICDEGAVNTAWCDFDCTPAACGDGTVNPVAGEVCDPGGTDSADCDNDCTVPVCGDGIVNAAAHEQCDDGNTEDGDFCTAICEPADCQDGILNADESDVDCGGQCGATCTLWQTCRVSSDCGSGPCVVGICRTGRLATGFSHTCALLAGGAVRCWGHGGYGKLGHGNTDNIGDDEPANMVGDVDVGGPVIQLAAGRNHTCSLLAGGAVRCWGYGSAGQLGHGNTDDIGDDEAPSTASDVDVGGPVIQLAAGNDHTCALLSGGAVRCWGRGFYGRLGYGNTDDIGDDETPSAAGDVDVGGTVTQLTAGSEHTCALLAGGTVRCWGYGSAGQLGYGNTGWIGDNETPSTAGDIDVGGPVTQLAAGWYHTCALLAGGAVRCWGAGVDGLLGHGNTDWIGDDETPSEAGDVDVGGAVTQLAAGTGHTCALLAGGAVRCWGNGSGGQLGYGNTDNIGDDEAPSVAGDVDVGGPVTQLAAGGSHTCALLTGGAVRCWGNGYTGQLGHGNTANIGDNETPASAGDVPYE